MNLDVFVPALIIGVMGAGHCLGMCGGIAAALGFAIPDASQGRKLQLIFAYNVGRISSYVCIGAVAGIVGSALGASVPALPVLRVIAGVMLILMGLYITGWWRVLTHLEKIGTRIWRPIQAISQRVMPVKSIFSALLLGVLWGWLPCGLVYSVLVLALAQGHAVDAATVMLGFGLGTLPAVMLGGLAAERLKTWLQHSALRTLMGGAVIVFGVWTTYFALASMGHASHHGSPANQSQHLHHH